VDLEPRRSLRPPLRDPQSRALARGTRSNYWHAVEKAWEFARLRYGPESKQAANWVARIGDDLRAGRVGAVLLRLKGLECATEEQRDKLLSLIKYYTDNLQRMRYDEYIRLGYGIGSGAVNDPNILVHYFPHQRLEAYRLSRFAVQFVERRKQKLRGLPGKAGQQPERAVVGAYTATLIAAVGGEPLLLLRVRQATTHREEGRALERPDCGGMLT
jgi:hypothetical protein